jgi:hypothetical protein
MKGEERDRGRNKEIENNKGNQENSIATSPFISMLLKFVHN